MELTDDQRGILDKIKFCAGETSTNEVLILNWYLILPFGELRRIL
jgi:hypothetical protein